jgi:acyl-CoA synthetase (AMP-forming)/AMP-acid ligase II
MFVRDYLERNAASWPDRPSYVSARAHHTWGETAERSHRLAAALQDLGIGKGDVVASMMRDSHETVELWFAAAITGAIRTGINYRYAPRDIAHILTDSKAKILLVEGGECEQALNAITAELPYLRVVIGIGDHHREHDYEAILTLAPEEPERPDIQPTDAAAISYTTGSTGRPKGVIWSHAAIREVCLNTFWQAGMTHDERFMHCLPAAGVPILLATWNVFNGACVVLLDQFSPAAALEMLETERCTSVLWVPTMMSDVLSDPSFDQRDLTALRTVMYGSSPATPALVRRAIDMFGCQIQQWYGSTEATAGWTNMLHHEDHLRALAGRPELLSSCGRAMVHCEVRVLRDDSTVAEPDEIGEVCVRSDTLMLGYLGMPEESERALQGGWLHMGDIGRMDCDGYLYLVDRKNFLIITGGYNVFPIVVENVLAEHLGVSEVCVVGVPDDRWGEAVVACIVPRNEDLRLQASVLGAETADTVELRDLRDELLAHARRELAKFEVPKDIQFVSGLPRGATGKLFKRAVRDTLRQAASQSKKPDHRIDRVPVIPDVRNRHA